MITLLHISDPHFGTERPEVVEALVSLSRRVSPQLLIVSGDLTQRAKSEQFQAASAFINRLGVSKKLVIAGNHDIPLFDLASRFFTPYARFGKVFGNDMEPIANLPGVLVVGVKTTRRYRHIDGQVSAQQIDRVAGLLKNAHPSQLKVVVTHQPVCVTHEEDKADLLKGHEQAIKAWSQAGANLILGGHIHRPFVCALHEQNPALTRQIWAVQAGTAVSSRIRHDVGNSVNLIRFELATPRQCVVERWDYNETSHAFESKQTDTLDCEPMPAF